MCVNSIKRYLIYVAIICVGTLNGYAQNYHAIQGSAYAGGLGVHNNPASIVGTPLKWDVTLVGLQAKASTNIIKTRNYSLLSPPSKSEYYIKPGEFKRQAVYNTNLNVFNARYSINRQQAFSFGANFRNYGILKTDDYYYHDSIADVGEFFLMNLNNRPMGLEYSNSGWMEIYGSYAWTLIERDDIRLNVGGTLKLMRGFAGGHARIRDGQFTPLGGNPPLYSVDNAGVNYGYSANMDKWNNANSWTRNVKDLLIYTEGGAGIDLGAEFIIKTQAVSDLFDDDDFFDYRWKIGVSLLDLGANQYKYGKYSRSATGLITNLNNTTIEQKFDGGISNIESFNDSLRTIAQQFGSFNGKFRVLLPTRLVVNADYFIQGNFFLNMEASVNLSGVLGRKFFYVRDMNLFSVTPRWETRNWGVYLPLSFNTQKQFWIGGAVKAGPVLFGLHNLGFLFSKKSIPNGGFYLAITLKSWQDTRNKKDERLDCPPGK